MVPNNEHPEPISVITHEDIIDMIKRHEQKTTHDNRTLQTKVERWSAGVLITIISIIAPLLVFLFSLSGKVEANAVIAASADDSVGRIEQRLDEFQRFLREDNRELRQEISNLRRVHEGRPVDKDF